MKGSIGPKIEDKVLKNIAKGQVHPVTPFMNDIFGVYIGKTFLNVDIIKRTCTCGGWKMLGIPCEHATTVILSIGHYVADFVDNCYKFSMQELIYTDSFSDIETHYMSFVDDDGLVRTIIDEVFFSLKPLHTKCPNFKINRVSIAFNVICSEIIGKRERIICLKSIVVTFFHY